MPARFATVAGSMAYVAPTPSLVPSAALGGIRPPPITAVAPAALVTPVPRGFAASAPFASLSPSRSMSGGLTRATTRAGARSPSTSCIAARGADVSHPRPIKVFQLISVSSLVVPLTAVSTTSPWRRRRRRRSRRWWAARARALALQYYASRHVGTSMIRARGTGTARTTGRGSGSARWTSGAQVDRTLP